MNPAEAIPVAVAEPERQVSVLGAWEVIVLGGGPAGIAAAASAARRGRKVLLVERYGFLGGMGTAAGVTNFCGLFANVHGDIQRVVRGIADDLLDRIDRIGGLNAPHLILGRTYGQAYDTAAYKIAADALLAEAGVEILFHALGAGVVMSAPGEIRALFVETKAGRRAALGRIFVDASGDGDLAAWAGAAFEVGDGDGGMLFPTTMFRVNGVAPSAVTDEAWKTIPILMDEAARSGRRNFPRRGAIVRPQTNPAEWRVNVTQLKNADGRAVSGIDPAELSRGEIEGRRQVLAFAEFLRDEVPGFERSYVVDIAPQIGIRETRRITGAYRLTGQDVIACASFEDTVGVNGWPLEKHVAGDVEWVWPDIPGSRGFNHLPYRMMLPLGVDNLFVVGRCASMDHDGQSAARVTGACFVMGEAAGTAADLALQAGVAPADLDIGQLQDELARAGVYLGRSLDALRGEPIRGGDA